MAWLPLEEGPMPVAMDTKEKGSPEEVQVEEPELMGAMSAEEAGDAVGLRRSPAAEGKKTQQRASVGAQHTTWGHHLAFSSLFIHMLFS